jgi:hypothetical protein
MTTTVSAFGSSYIMAGLRDAIDSGTAAGYVEFYDGTRPADGGTPTGSLISLAALADPCGIVDGAGALQFSAGVTGPVLVVSMPTWARIYSSAANRVIDCACRSNAAADLGEELVVDAAALAAGASLRILSGAYRATP